ncbi:MAG: HAMP domain-containing protein [Cyanobacteria bacterium]|nr:HAMP domain-containing protein [Cyanobacteria bacterium GSL.Bin21]
MTNLKENPKTSLPQPETLNGQAHQPSLEPTAQQRTPSQPTGKKSMGLRERLLLSVVPTALIPLAVAGWSGWWVIHENLEARYRENLQKVSLLAGEASSQVLSNLRQIPEAVVSNPLIVSAAREASSQMEAEQLTALPIEQLEERFSDTKLVDPNPALNNYLQQVAAPEQVTEIFFTEKNGFNVAHNQPTSDFVQRDDIWWQNGKAQGLWLGDLEFDESVGTAQIETTHAITDPESGEFLGVLKMGISGSAFRAVETYLEYSDILETEQVQVIDASTAVVFATVTDQGAIEREAVEGGDAVKAMAKAMAQGTITAEASLKANLDQLANQYNLSSVEIDSETLQEGILSVAFIHEGRFYEMAAVPDTDWVAIASVEERILQEAGNEVVAVFALVGVLLGVGAIGVAFLLARQFASPLANVSQSAQKAAAGDLSARAEPQGSYETQLLAESYNNLVERVQQLLKEQAESAEQQRQQREVLEEEVVNLMTDIENAADGDLTVRAQLMEGDIGVVADLFNAVVENLQDTAQQVKAAASRVSDSLGENEIEIRKVAEGAIAEAEEIQSTLNSVEAMNRSIQEVAQNAQKAATIADTALITAQEGNQAMDQTVQSIQGLRSTVGETAKKMKQMGESAQKISQVVSLIDEISLKTSLLAINASVEAHRAGELGQGFTAVAEQVESLAEQSASAAQEIAQIVANIQNETKEAIETMEQGTSEVVESSRSVEETKARLAEVVARSEEINNLMQSISDSTVSQAETSQAVSRLMEQVTQSSQQRSETSKEVAQAIQETAKVAQSLETSVEQFKVEK